MTSEPETRGDEILARGAWHLLKTEGSGGPEGEPTAIEGGGSDARRPVDTGLAPGTRIAVYEILGLLGRGGMGAVYRARQSDLDREVALKVLEGVAGSELARRRFEREARSASRLAHPSIVQVHAFHVEGGRACYSMELVEGPSLSAVLAARESTLPPLEAARLVRELAEATHYAHRNGVVHRDLKPGNVLMRPDGRPAIADFGLARLSGDEELTRSGEVLGTPAYMSPEQADGREAGPASDVYALGAILYQCLALRPPFRGPTAVEILYAVLHMEPEPLSRAAPGAPRDLATICHKAMDKDPGRRYESARALAEDLQRFLDGEPVRARRIGPLERVLRWTHRHRGVAAITLASVLALAALLVYHVVRLQGEVERTESARREAVRAAEVQEARNRVYEAIELHRQRYPAERVRSLLDQAEGVEPDYAPIHRLRGELEIGEEDFEAAERELSLALELDPADDVAAFLLYRLRVLTGRGASPETRDLLRRAAEGGATAAGAFFARAQDLFDRARALERRDTPRSRALFAQALDEAREAERADPASGHPAALAGRILLALGDIEGSTRSLERALELEPRLIDVLLLLASARLAAGHPGPALADLERAEGVGLAPPDAPYLRARCLVELGRIAEARTILEGCLARDPDDARALADLSLVRFREGDLERALGASARARELRPADPEIGENHVLLLLRSGRLEEGARELEAWLEAAPGSAQAHHLRGYLLGRTRRPAEEMAEYDRAIELHPASAEFYNSRGVARLEAGNFEGARDDLVRAVELAPGVALHRRNLGLARQRLGDFEGAWSDYREAIRLSPDDADGYVKRAHLHQDLGHRSEARRDLDRAIELAPGNATARSNRGYLNHLEGRNDEALLDLEAALAADPDYAPAISNRGLVRLAGGDLERARDDFARARALDPEDLSYAWNLAYALYCLGDADGALPALEAVVSREPARAEAWHLLGVVQEARNEPKEALAALRKAVELDQGLGAQLAPAIEALERRIRDSR